MVGNPNRVGRTVGLVKILILQLVGQNCVKLLIKLNDEGFNLRFDVSAFTFSLRSSKLHSLLIPLLLTSRGVSHSTGPLCLRCDTPPSTFCGPGFGAPPLFPAAGLGTKFPDQLLST